MADLKWADVAHYYLTSEISIEGGFEILEWRPDSICLGSELFNQGEGVFYDSWEEIENRPILRHLEDITEGEARELFSCCRAQKWEEWVALRLYADCKSFMVGYCKGLRMFISETHWLISKGFDVFGLIDSGQAIRKEVSNV